MKITLITSEKLSEFPPIITLLNTLNQLGHKVKFITPYHDNMFDDLELTNVEHLFVSEEPDERLTCYYSNRIKASMAFRTERLIRKLALRRIPGIFLHDLKNADVVWVLHENTMLLGGKHFADKIGDYLYTMYELQVKNGGTPDIYNYTAKKALLNVVPEYCRAHIVKAFYTLKEIPAVIPNKPLNHPLEKNIPISDCAISDEIEKIKANGKKIVMYMGILSNERPLEPVIEAVNSTDKYVLAVLGARTPYLDRLEQSMGGRFIYLGSVKPPYHLETASHADVAYISYVAQNGSINAVFCAPNKVYEFAGFGIPMLCNDNPGLKFTVEYSGMGVCADELSVSSIKNALEKIEENYEDMSSAARNYYDRESVENAVTSALERYMKIKERKQN